MTSLLLRNSMRPLISFNQIAERTLLDIIAAILEDRDNRQ